MRYLKEHIQSKHENKFKFKCEICHLTFSKRRTYIDHVNIHEGRKPWVCNICGKSFTQQSTLNKHKLAHVSGPEYVCYACVPNQCYKHINTIQKHIRLAHPQYADNQSVDADGKPIFGVEINAHHNGPLSGDKETPTVHAVQSGKRTRMRTAHSSVHKVKKDIAEVNDIILVTQT